MAGPTAHGMGDGTVVAASLAAWIEAVTFVDRGAEDVTALLVDAVSAWAAGRGWRVYRRAPSVLRLPPPYSHQFSCLDVACARPGAAPIAIEVDRADRQRSIDKLLAEAAAGRVALWVRWGSGAFTAPPPPIRMVTCPVTARRGPVGTGRLHSRLPTTGRPAPAHSESGGEPERQTELFDSDDTAR